MYLRLITCLFILIIIRVEANAQYPVPYQSAGVYYARNFKAGNNSVRAQMQDNIGLTYHIKPGRYFILEWGLGLSRFRRNLLPGDSANISNPGAYDYKYMLYGGEALFNLKGAFIRAERGDRYLKVYPLLGIGIGGVFSQSRELKTADASRQYSRQKPLNNVNYTLKAGIEIAFNDCATRKYVGAIGCFYAFNRFAGNTALAGDNHNFQLQLRLSVNFERKPKRIGLE